LPRFGEFALDYVERKVQHHLDRSLEQVCNIIELESLAVVTPPRTCQTTELVVSLPLSTDDVCVGLLMSGDNDECAICTESLTNSESVHLLRCCSKMFHKACLDRLPGRSAGLYDAPSPLRKCPLCRVPIGSAPTTATAASAATKVLLERRRQVVGQARRAASGMLRGLGDEFVPAVPRNSFQELACSETKQSGKHLLEEREELEEKRVLLRRQLQVMQEVREQVNQWEREWEADGP